MNVTVARAGRHVLLFTVCAVLGTEASAQCFREDNQKLLFTYPTSWDEFGKSVDLCGDLAVIGARRDHTAGVADAGTATVFRLNLGQWSQERVLRAADRQQGDELGTSVAVSGNWVIAGAPKVHGTFQDEGAAYAFEWNGFQWLERQKLMSSDPDEFGSFGSSCAVQGDLAAVGERGDDRSGLFNAGAVYVYRYDGVSWVEEQKLVASDAVNSAVLGVSVAIAPTRDVIVAGAYGDPTAGFFTGAAYVYRHDGMQWVEEQKLLASDGAASDYFGLAVAVEGNLIAAGAPFDDGFDSFSGSAYVYRFDGTLWQEEAKLNTGDTETNEYFGYGLGLEGNTLVVSAPEDNVGSVGAAGSTYVYRHDGATWVLGENLASRDPLILARQGYSTAIDDARVLVGAPYDDNDTTPDAGAAYVYRLSDRDMTLDVSPNVVQVGDSINFTSWCGPQSLPVWLFTAEINGAPSIFRVTRGVFTVNGKWSMSASVPPGVFGLLISFQTIAFDASGKPKFSNFEEATFQ